MLAGHADLSTTQRYIEADVEAQRRVVASGPAPDCLAAAHDGFFAHCSDPRAALRVKSNCSSRGPPHCFLRTITFDRNECDVSWCASPARTPGDALVPLIGDGVEQVLHAVAPDRSDNAELGEMRADGVDDRGLLPR